jgi:hypothetical protein
MTLLFLMFIMLHTNEAANDCSGLAVAVTDSLISVLPKYPNHSGCAIEFTTESDDGSTEFIFVAPFDCHIAWMNIDGQNEELRLVSKKEPEKWTVGEELRYEFAATDITVSIVMTIVSVPDGKSESEAIRVRGFFQAKKGKRTHTVVANGVFSC